MLLRVFSKELLPYCLQAYLPLGWYPWAGFARGKHEAVAHSRRHMDPHLGHNGAPMNRDLEAARPAANNSVV